MDNEHPVTRAELREELTVSQEHLMEKMREIETNLLTAFHGFARATNTRLHDLDGGQHDLKLRVSSLEDRVLALETRRPQQN